MTCLRQYFNFPLLGFIFFNICSTGCDRLDRSPVYLTVSSLYKETQLSSFIDRQIQLNWDNRVESVALFDSDPVSGAKPVVLINSTRHLTGFYESDLTLGNSRFPGGWELNSTDVTVPGEHCLPFWIAALKKGGGEITYLDCLKIRPTWMFDNRLTIGSLDLESLFIPGTHNSGCYKRGKSLSQKDISNRYILTQDQDIWSQLVYGIRYLDLRVGYYPIRKGGRQLPCIQDCFWVNHDLIKVRPLLPILREIKEFLNRAKGEVVILDFHRFPVGFSGRPIRHQQLIDLVHSELGEFALTANRNGTKITLDKIWEQGNKRLIIAYGDNDTVHQNDWLWSGISQKWGNKQSASSLDDYITQCMESSSSPAVDDHRLWSAMVHLTPAPLDLIFNPRGSLRQMAHSISRNVSDWAANKWWKYANIVATDFFMENDIINIALLANNKKGYSQKQYSFV